MIDIYPPEPRGPPLTNEDGILRCQSMWMTGNLQFDPQCHFPTLRRTLVLLLSLVMIMWAGEPMCGTIVVEVLLAVIRGNRVKLEDLTDSEVLIEWNWTGTMIEYPGIHTYGIPLEYLRVPTFVIANGEFGIAHDGQNRPGMIPTMMIFNIDRAVLPLILTGTDGTRTATTDLGGRTKIDSGIRVDLGQIGTGDLSSVILLLLLA